jgi:hypothetical protein
VEKSLYWDYSAVSTRWTEDPLSKEQVCGHHGEWFSTAVAAYAALRNREPVRAKEIAEKIIAEVEREAGVYQAFRKAKNGIEMLRTSTLIAHNLGDLDRVIEAWNLPEQDFLRLAVYKSGHEPTRVSTQLLHAGNLNKTFMASENHRHYPLRIPRCLRKSADVLLPVGPFFDDWGKTLAKHPLFLPEEVAEVAVQLIAGWEKLPGTVGYARALAGIEQGFAGGLNRLVQYMPSRVAKTLKTGALRRLCTVSRERFENQWAQSAIAECTSPLHKESQSRQQPPSLQLQQ